ncbi:type 1 glutamine amidotransferase [Thermosynechococcaceae cyanobacterium Okahandja]
MRLHYLQHVPFEPPAQIATWAKARGHSWQGTHLYVGEGLPRITDIDAVIVMGGPMGVDDEAHYSWLAAEKAFLAAAIARGLPILGICLGAQLLAQVLGARVTPGATKEIGWYPIELTTAAQAHPWFQAWPESLTVFHWHGDTFSLPDGALPLASSAACAQQGFLWGDRLLGLQFHLEVTPASIAELLHHGQAELVAGEYIQSAADIMANADQTQRLTPHLEALLDHWLKHNSGSSSLIH